MIMIHTIITDISDLSIQNGPIEVLDRNLQSYQRIMEGRPKSIFIVQKKNFLVDKHGKPGVNFFITFLEELNGSDSSSK